MRKYLSFLEFVGVRRGVACDKCGCRTTAPAEFVDRGLRLRQRHRRSQGLASAIRAVSEQVTPRVVSTLSWEVEGADQVRIDNGIGVSRPRNRSRSGSIATTRQHHGAAAVTTATAAATAVGPTNSTLRRLAVRDADPAPHTDAGRPPRLRLALAQSFPRGTRPAAPGGSGQGARHVHACDASRGECIEIHARDQPGLPLGSQHARRQLRRDGRDKLRDLRWRR